MEETDKSYCKRPVLLCLRLLLFIIKKITSSLTTKESQELKAILSDNLKTNIENVIKDFSIKT